MKLQLNINEDKELRDYIKSCINNQVVALVREEITETIKAEFKRKFANGIDEHTKNKAFESAAKEVILKANGLSEWDRDYIKPIAIKLVHERIEKMIDTIDWQKSIQNTINGVVASMTALKVKFDEAK